MRRMPPHCGEVPGTTRVGRHRSAEGRRVDAWQSAAHHRGEVTGAQCVGCHRTAGRCQAAQGVGRHRIGISAKLPLPREFRRDVLEMHPKVWPLRHRSKETVRAIAAPVLAGSVVPKTGRHICSLALVCAMWCALRQPSKFPQRGCGATICGMIVLLCSVSEPAQPVREPVLPVPVPA
eukprot:gene7254-biopygen16538